MEKIVTINLTGMLKKPTSKRGRRAIDLLRAGVAKETKNAPGRIVIDNSINSLVFANLKNPARRVRVKIVTDEKNVYVLPPEKELKREQKEAKEKVEKKEIKGAETKGKETVKVEEEKPAPPKPKFEQKKMEEAGKK
jgi:ribosomal protein L31E